MTLPLVIVVVVVVGSGGFWEVRCKKVLVSILIVACDWGLLGLLAILTDSIASNLTQKVEQTRQLSIANIELVRLHACQMTTCSAICRWSSWRYCGRAIS